jgi:hypothetical protein
MKMHCCDCYCAPCKPRYRRLVDAIYDEHGLIKSNMQKLTFYAISHPEKLDRIGDYLLVHLSRDLYRMRRSLIKVSSTSICISWMSIWLQVSVEAMDQLMQSCHASPSLNLFVEHFLKMMQKLLETNEAELEVGDRMWVNWLIDINRCLQRNRLSTLGILKRTRHRIIDDMTSLFTNLLRCVTRMWMNR